jgi:large subunit ribosomal protein L10
VITFDRKQKIVEEVQDMATTSVSVVVLDYLGLNSSQMLDLRASARDKKVCVRVIRNRLAKRALENTSFSSIHEDLKGSCLFLFAYDSPGDAASVASDFIKSHKVGEVRVIGLVDERIEASRLKEIASLPTKEVALAMLMRSLMAPAQNLASGLIGVPQKLHTAFQALSEKN